MNLPSLEDLVTAGVENTLGSKIERIDFKEIRPCHHSITSVIRLELESGECREVFFKSHALPSKTASATEPLDILHRREYAVFRAIYHNISPNIVPRTLGRIGRQEEGDFLLVTEYLPGKNAREKFFEIAVEPDPARQKEKRLTLLRESFRQIARFNGLCHSHKNQFSPSFYDFIGTPEEVYQNKQVIRQRRALNYLLRTIHFQELGGREFQESDGNEGEFFDDKNSQDLETVLRYIQQRKKVNLRERLDQIFALEKAIRVDVRLQHGDCRLQHNFAGKFCDLEDFGYYPNYYDITTYTSEEIATPLFDQLPGLLAYYLVYEKAYGSRSRDYRIKELKKLDQEDPQNFERLLSQKSNINDFADFVVGYLSEVLIENDIILNGVRKKYSRAQLHEIFPPSYPLDDLHLSKYRHIQEVYTYFTFREEPKILDCCTHGKEVRSYFFQLGKLLQDLGLVELEGLGVLSNGSQWDLQKIFTKK